MAVISPQEQPRVTVQVPVPTPVQPATYAPAFQPPPQQQVAQQTQVMPNAAYQQAFAPQSAPQPMPVQTAPQPAPQQQPQEQDYFTPKKYSGPVAFIFPHAGAKRPRYRPKKMARLAKAVRKLARAERPVRKSMTDMAAFHEGMLAEPNDSLRPLVYADWLDDHDKPMAARVIRAHGEVNAQPTYQAIVHPQSQEPGSFRASVMPRIQGSGFDVYVHHPSAAQTEGGRAFRWHAPGEYFDGMNAHQVADAFEREGATVNRDVIRAREKVAKRINKGGEA